MNTRLGRCPRDLSEVACSSLGSHPKAVCFPALDRSTNDHLQPCECHWAVVRSPSIQRTPLQQSLQHHLPESSVVTGPPPVRSLAANHSLSSLLCFQIDIIHMGPQFQTGRSRNADILDQTSSLPNVMIKLTL